MGKSFRSARRADGSSPLTIIGGASVCLTRGNGRFAFTGLVVQNLDVELLAGTPFMEINDVAIRPAKRSIGLADGTTYTYGTTDNALNRHAIRRSHVLRAPSTNTTVWPGGYVEVNLPADLFVADHSLWNHGLVRVAAGPCGMMVHGRGRRLSLALTVCYACRA